MLLIFSGAVEIALDDGPPVRANAREVFSVPENACRRIGSVGDAPAEIAVLTAGDHKKRLVSPEDALR